MYTSEYTAKQKSFLQLFHLAARCDCLYLLDFYCQHLFDHDQTSLLSDNQRALLAEAAQDDIFAKAAENAPGDGAADLDGQPDGQFVLSNHCQSKMLNPASLAPKKNFCFSFGGPTMD